MSYSILYTFPEREAQEGPFLASGSGWHDWCEAVLEIDGFPECHTLAVKGWAMAGELAGELARLPSMGEDLDGVTDSLKHAADTAPAGCECLVATDGTDAGEGDEDD